MNADLYDYQKQALHWFMCREKADGFGDENREIRKLHPMWAEFIVKIDKPENEILLAELRNLDKIEYETPLFTFYFNPFSGQISHEFPGIVEGVRGGILADEMGLGKTVMMLSLIHSHRPSYGCEQLEVRETAK